MSAVRQRDVEAAVRGAQRAGLTIARVEITREGRILILPVGATGAPTGDELEDELMEWRRARGEG